MAKLSEEATADLWRLLSWNSARLELTAKGYACVRGLPDSPGLYKVWWTDPETWPMLSKNRRVGATKTIQDPLLVFDDLMPPLVLSVGRSTKLKSRFESHLGRNPKSNRLLKRLTELLPDLNIYEMMVRALEIEWVEVSSWTDRCVLEAYGKATLRPILDVDAEH